jgi:type IV secretion system protein VirB6
MSSAVTQMVTGNNASPFQSIDNNLALMQGGMAIVDALDTGGNDKLESEKTQDKWFTGIGIAGPGVIAGCMLLLNKIALALFIGFGPFFIMTLMFEQTKSFFSKWLFYGMGTLFSLAVLSVMVGIAMKMVGAVSATFIANYLTAIAQGGNPSDGINSMAMQQGGLGLILTTLIISAPPMAAAFFQGTLGQIMTYSPFGNIGRPSESKQPGMAGYLPPQPNQALPRERVAQNTFANHPGAGPNNSPATNGDYVKQSQMQSGGQQQ